MQGGMKQPPCSLLSHQTVKPQPDRRKTRWSDWAYILCFYCRGSVRPEAFGGVLPVPPRLPLLAETLTCPWCRVDHRVFDEDLGLGLLCWRGKLLKRTEGRACRLLYGNVTDGWAISKAENATLGGTYRLYGVPVSASLRSYLLVSLSAGPCFLGPHLRTAMEILTDCQTSCQRQTPPAFLWRPPRTVHGVALGRICIPQAPAFTVHVRSLYDWPIYIFIQPSFLWCFGGLIQLSAGVFLVQPCMATRASSNVICSEVTFVPRFNLRTDSILAAIISFSVSPEQKSVWCWLHPPLPRHSLGSHWEIFQLPVR